MSSIFFMSYLDNIVSLMFKTVCKLVLSQMLIAGLALTCAYLAWGDELAEIRTCRELEATNPCAIRDAGCMCIYAISKYVEPSMVEHCGWPLEKPVCDPQPEMSLISLRMKKLRKMLDTWSSIGTISSFCFDHAECNSVVSEIASSNATLTAMHNLGTFKGPEAWCDFIGLTTHYVSKNIFSMLFLSSFPDSKVVQGVDGNSYSVKLTTCAVRTHTRPNAIISLVFNATFFPNSDMMESLAIEDTVPGATWIRETGFEAVSTSPLWMQTRVSCGFQDVPEMCTTCLNANRTILALLAEIRPSVYCTRIEGMKRPPIAGQFSGLRHARVC